MARRKAGNITMKNEALANLKELLERRYGPLDDPRGCYVNGSWLSLERIVELIDKVDAEC